MNNYYRYCFACDKWLTKQEVKEVDWGEQPGGGMGKAYNCKYCHKDLGDTIQIFRCPNHEDVILKVWGSLDGENKEKIFYKQCPKENKQEQPPKPPEKNKPNSESIILGIGIAIFIMGALAWVLYELFRSKKRKEN